MPKANISIKKIKRENKNPRDKQTNNKKRRGSHNRSSLSFLIIILVFLMYSRQLQLTIKCNFLASGSLHYIDNHTRSQVQLTNVITVNSSLCNKCFHLGECYFSSTLTNLPLFVKNKTNAFL